MFTKLFGTIAVACAMVAAVPASAASVAFTTNNGTNTSGTLGNTLGPFGSGSVTVTSASAWTSTGSGTPAQAYVGRYTNGLGVTTQAEGNGQTNNSHTIDNVGSYDFIMLVFSQAVRLTGITLVGYDVDNSPSTVDTDAWVSYGNSTNLANATVWSGYLGRGVEVGSGLAANFVGNDFSTVWLIGASRSTTERNDGFKLSAVTAIPPGVPEPSTWLMMIVGFGLMGTALRRRAQATEGLSAAAA